MNDALISPNAAERRPGFIKAFVEACFVAAIGVVVAVVANAVSPRGLTLAKNYFPSGTNGVVAAPIVAPSPASGDAETNQLSAAQALIAQLKEKGLQVIDHEQAVRLFRNPDYQQQQIIFVDGRDEQTYRQGHIPGAYEFDPYQSGKNLMTVFPVCLAAEQVVVYCKGGDCEDSEFAAIALRDAGIPNQKLFVYPGGMADWETNNLPVEIGARDSGVLRNASR